MPKEKTLADLRDSRLQYDKNPPPFGMALILIVLVFLILLGIWSTQATKPYVVKSSGTVASQTKNYIMSAYTGQITQALVSEGDYVQEGDVLFRIASTDLDLQAQQLQGMIEVSQKKISQYQRLEACIKEGVNLFDENNEADKPYYYQYQTYLSQVNQKELDVSAYKAYDYTDEQIESAIKTNEAAVAEIYYSTLKAIADAKQTAENELATYQVQLASVASGQAEYPVLASTSGIVHMDTAYKTGMVVQAAAALGSIVGENDRYIASVYTAAADRPLINQGDRVEVAVSGLIQSIYGTVGGGVRYIASEATVDSEQKTSAFLVEIELDSLYLVSKEGNKVNLSNGMAVEARIHYDELTYFNHLLEALGVLVR